MSHTLIAPLLWAGSLAVLGCATPAQAQVSGEVEVALPAQDLSASLRALSLQTGRSIVVSADLVRGRRAPAVSGSLSVEEALRRLLAGTGLDVRRVGPTLVVVGAGGSESPATGPAAGVGDAATSTIVVTGTHLRTVPASSPTITIDRDEIDRSGATSIEQLMRKLPQNSQGGINQENFEIVLPDQDVTDHGAGVNLRGLGQRATLVLLDGRRLAPSGSGAFVDVSLIPISLVERVDILTDGASAIYGSDAVGGVVNFVLRQDLSGFETTAQAGTTTRGGGDQLLLSQAAGGHWSGGRGLLAYEYRQEDEIRAGDREFTISYDPNNFLLPRERRHSVLGNVELDLAPGLTLSAAGTYAHRSTARTYYESASVIPIDGTANADAVTASGELTYSFAGSWRAQFEGNYALSQTDERQVQPGGLDLANARDVRNEIVGGAIRADGPLFDLPGGPVRMAVGAELRHERYRDGFESTAIAREVSRASRDVRSVFGELSIPLVTAGNGRPGLERLELSAAGRFDAYTATGSAFDPKVGALWSPVAGADLRMSYGTSYRAPLLSEIGGSYNVFYAPASFIYKDRTAAPPGSIALILQGSNPDIRPETSRTWSFGADFAPTGIPGLKLSLSYYAIRFADRIASPIRVLAVVGDPAFDPIIDRSPGLAELTGIVGGADVSFDATGPGLSDGHATPADVDIVLDTRINNTAETSTDGFDLSLRYAFAAGPNRFVLDANVNHVLSFNNRLTPASPDVSALDKLYGPLAWRARGALGWDRGPWSASLAANFAGDYQDDRALVLMPIDASITTDLSVSYAFTDAANGWLQGARITLYGENLFDAAPPRVLPDPGRTRGLGYDPVNASGRGRFLSLQLRKSW